MKLLSAELGFRLLGGPVLSPGSRLGDAEAGRNSHFRDTAGYATDEPAGGNAFN